MNLLVDDLEKARQNRQRVTHGYCNPGYDTELNSMRNVQAIEPSFKEGFALGFDWLKWSIPRTPVRGFFDYGEDI